MATLLFFGKLADVTGASHLTRPLPGHVTHTGEARIWIDTCFGGDGVFLEPTTRIAINDEIVGDTAALSDTDTIAFLPPVGGG